MVRRTNLFVPGKMDYVTGKANRVAGRCILCAVAAGADDVAVLDVARQDGFIITLNLYPYNAGHVMLFPRRHVEDPRDLGDDESLALSRLTKLTLDVLEREYAPAGFNVGFNIGAAAGASIAHLHLHVVPRYRNEAGIIEVLGGAKIVVEDPHETRARLRKAFAAALKNTAA